MGINMQNTLEFNKVHVKNETNCNKIIKNKFICIFLLKISQNLFCQSCQHQKSIFTQDILQKLVCYLKRHFN